MKTDTDLLNWLAKNPTAVTWAQGYHGSKSAWHYNSNGTILPARSLRDAIRKAMMAAAK